MGLRSSFIPIKNKADLTAILLMELALNEVAEYDCAPCIHYFCEYEGQVYCAFSQDGSSAFLSYYLFSKSFYYYLPLEVLPLDSQNGWIGSKILYAKDLEDRLK